MSKTKAPKRVATVQIGEKVFKAPPFSVEFELEQKLESFTKTIVKLYNPNEETINACRIEHVNGQKNILTKCQVDAGYEDDHGICAKGEVARYDTFKQGPDRILELQISDLGRWRDKVINKHYKNRMASEILTDVTKGQIANIELGKDVLIKNLKVLTPYHAIEALYPKTDSEYAIRNGVLIMHPAKYTKDTAFNLSYDTGLVETPERVDNEEFHGWRIQTRFIFGLDIWRFINVNTGEKIISGQVIKVNKRFSTFVDETSEYEIRDR
jgi:hypothetical protein